MSNAIKHDENATHVYRNDKREVHEPYLGLYKGTNYGANEGEVRVSVIAYGGSLGASVKRTDLLEALGVSPALLNDLAQALKVHDDIDSLPRGDDEQADQVHARRGDTVALAAEALMKAVQQ